MRHRLRCWAECSHPRPEVRPPSQQERQARLGGPSEPRLRLRFTRKTPTANDDIRLTYTIRHVLTNVSTTSTVIDQDVFNGIVYQTLVLALRAKASKFNESTDASIEADIVNLQAAASNFLFLAERHERTYKLFVGKSDDVKAAQAFSEKDIRFAHGEPLLFHNPRNQ